MKKIISTLENLLSRNKANTNHLPALRPVCLIQIQGCGNMYIDLNAKTIKEDSKVNPDCTITFTSEAQLNEVLNDPGKAWIQSGRNGSIKVSDNFSGAILLESLFPGTLASILRPRQFYSLFPHLVPNEYKGHTTEEFFETLIPQKIANNPQLLNTAIAAFQFDIDGAGSWTVDMTTTPGSVYAGPAKAKGSIIATDRKTFEEILNDDSKAWNYFNSGRISVSNACRASQVVNALWPTAFAKAMPGSLHSSLFPNEMGDPSAPEYNKTTGNYVTYIMGQDGPVPINYSRMGETAIFQGDIILGKVEEMEAIRMQVENKADLPLGVRIYNWGDPSQYVWPNGVIYYEKDSTLTNDAAKELRKAMDHWEAKTAVTFKERNSESNYVVVTDSEGCASNIGMIGGQQTIWLNKKCDFGAVVHEIGHTVGLFHEQSRIDRDTYVTIEWNQIEEAHKHNFNKVGSSYAIDLGVYDYGSIMHYSANAFATGKYPTIVTIPPDQPIGQRDGLSAKDIASVAAIYGAKPAIKSSYKEFENA